MNSRTLSLISTALVGIAPIRMSAQPVVQEITANPKAVQLRKIWEVTGGEFGGGEAGAGFGSIGDVNSDGIQDFAVHYGDLNEWHIYYGGPEPLDTTPARILRGLGVVPGYPVAGDFWGTGHKAVAFPNIDAKVAYGLSIFRTDSNRLHELPAAVLAPSKMVPPVRFSLRAFASADLDGDGADELILFIPGAYRNDVPFPRPEIWIYRGGPSFQVDTPTVVLRDDESSGGEGRQALYIGRWDNDEYLDLATASDYADKNNKLKFYFGRPGSPWNWSSPDHVASFGQRVVGDGGFATLDCDGDGVLDIADAGPPESVSLFLSSSGKSSRSRSFALEDADKVFHRPYYIWPMSWGYLNDSSRHYEVLAINGQGVRYGFSGGVGGPDSAYDLYSGDPGNAGVQPIKDVTGDGWNDLIGGWGTVNFNSGVAAVFAGGPYIPRDSSSGVRDLAVAGRPAAISTWPNPMVDELHIAWRGDLSMMPERFLVHDLPGRLVAEGHVESWRGEALWRCGDAESGVYLLSILDGNGHLLATQRLVKE